MKKALLLGVAIPVLLGAPMTFLSCGSSASASGGDAAGALYEVKRADLDITLTEDGTLVAKESKKLSFKIRRSGKITFLIPEGSEVAEGDVVCKLDPDNVQKRLEETELSLLTGQTSLNQAQTNLDIQKVDNISNVEKAENAALKAEKQLERYRDGDSAQEYSKLDVALKDATTSFTRAKKKYEDSVKLVELNYIRQAECDDHKIEFDKATVNKNGAALAIKLFNKYTKPMTMADKEIAVRDSARALDTTKKRAKSQLEQKEVSVTQAEKRVKRLGQQVKELKEDIEKMVLKAPVPGVVIYGDPRNPWNTEQVKIGSDMWPGFTVMTIPDLRVMLVKLEVHEADIAKVKPGQKAAVTFDTYPGMVLEAEVTKIAQVASGGGSRFQSASSVKKFDVEITIKSDPKVKLKPGISAKAEVFLDRLEDALFVPIQCVFVEGGKNYCNISQGTKVVRREVKVGPSNDNYTQILEGIAEGEKVLLYNPDLPSDTEESDAKGKGKESDGTKGKAKKPATTPATSPAGASKD